MTKKDRKCKKSQEQKNKVKEVRKEDPADQLPDRCDTRVSGESSDALDALLSNLISQNGSGGFRIIAQRNVDSGADAEDLDGRLVIDGHRILQACCPTMADMVVRRSVKIDGSLIIVKIPAEEEVTDRQGEKYSIKGSEIIRKYGECPFCSARAALRFGRRS